MESPLRPEKMTTFGPAVKIDALEIRWPDGTRETRRDIAPGVAVVIEEGAGSIERTERSATPTFESSTRY